MKYFSIATAAIISTTAVSGVMGDECFDSDAISFINRKINDTTEDISKLDRYLIRQKEYNKGQDTGSNFVTVMCKYAPWQYNNSTDSVYSPYDVTKWNRTVAAGFRQYRADRLAMKQWILDNGGTADWPASARPFGRYRCGNYKMANGTKTRGWKEKNKLSVVCPDFKSVNASINFVDSWKWTINNFCVKLEVATFPGGDPESDGSLSIDVKMKNDANVLNFQLSPTEFEAGQTYDSCKQNIQASSSTIESVVIKTAGLNDDGVMITPDGFKVVMDGEEFVYKHDSDIMEDNGAKGWWLDTDGVVADYGPCVAGADCDLVRA